MEDIQEILEDFLVEAFELIEQLDQNLVELESNPDDLELLNSIFRVAHTIKGSSSFLNFDVLTGLTHHMEDVLNKARHGDLKLTPEVMDVVLESIDLMKSLLHAIRDNGNDTSVGIDITDICRRLDIISNGESVAHAVVAEEVDESPVPSAEENDNTDYSKLSDKEVEDEIERLLKMRKEEDRKRREGTSAPKAAVSTPSFESLKDSGDNDSDDDAPKVESAPRRSTGGDNANTAPAKKRVSKFYGANDSC